MLTSRLIPLPTPSRSMSGEGRLPLRPANGASTGVELRNDVALQPLNEPLDYVEALRQELPKLVQQLKAPMAPAEWEAQQAHISKLGVRLVYYRWWSGFQPRQTVLWWRRVVKLGRQERCALCGAVSGAGRTSTFGLPSWREEHPRAAARAADLRRLGGGLTGIPLCLLPLQGL